MQHLQKKHVAACHDNPHLSILGPWHLSGPECLLGRVRDCVHSCRRVAISIRVVWLGIQRKVLLTQKQQWRIAIGDATLLMGRARTANLLASSW